MSAERYIIFKEKLLGSEELVGASADELRVLVVLLCLEGEKFDVDEICALLNLSRASVFVTSSAASFGTVSTPISTLLLMQNL